MIVRQSDLKQFGSCAYQYYLSKILDLGSERVGSLTVLGTVFHYAMEVYEHYGRDLDLAKRTFSYYWENPDELGETIDYWHRMTTWQGLHDRGINMLEQYHELAPFQGRLIGTEISFEVPLGEHTLQGTIDKLIARDGKKELHVIDLKTAALVPEKLRYNIQFTAYMYATLQPEFWSRVSGFETGYDEFKGYTRTGWWYHARNSKMWSAGYREQLDYQRLLLAVTEMDKAVKAGIFPLDIKGETCGFCPFAEEICGGAVG